VDDDVSPRERAIVEAMLAAWRALNDLRLADKFTALALLEQQLELELALFERAQVERVN
jgi:hypothetical protein